MSYQQLQTTNQRVSVIHVVVAWAAAVLTFAYFLPWAIAATRGESNSLAIGLVNRLADDRPAGPGGLRRYRTVILGGTSRAHQRELLSSA